MQTVLDVPDTASPVLQRAERTFFETLGDEIEAAWRAKDYDERSFPMIATDALNRRPPADHLDILAAPEWVLRTPTLPRQRVMNGEIEFGEPPIHVYDTPRFFIQVLYWLDGTTSIHQHGFSGAFHVLAGSSLHSQFTFETTRRVNAALRLGRIDLRSAEVLRPGATNPIVPGMSMIHSLFHLERPSATVVVRTPSDLETGPQYDYLRPGIAADPFAHPDLLRRRAQSLALYAKLGHPDFLPRLAETLSRADAFEVVYLMRATSQHLTLEQSKEALESARARHPMLVGLLIDAMANLTRQRMIIGLRRKLRFPNHRLFLALLMSFRSAEEVFSVLRAEYPYREPEDLVVDWLSDLSNLADPENPSKKVFGGDLDGSSLGAMRAMFGPRTADEILGSGVLSPEEAEGIDIAAAREELQKLLTNLRASVFATLFN
jgi:hypothetical protein